MSLKRKLLRVSGSVLILLLCFTLLMMGLVNSMLFFPETQWDDHPENYDFEFESFWIDLPKSETRINAIWLERANHSVHTLFLHGNAGNLSHRLHRFSKWKDVGNSFLIIDYPGFGKSEGEPSEESLYEAALASYDFMETKSGIDPDRIFAFGESIGGGVAVELASKRDFAGMILEATFTNLRSLAAIHYPFLPTVIVSGMFPSDRTIADLKIPILIVHGEEDEIVPADMSRELHARTAKRAKLLTFPGAHHNDVYLVGGTKYAEALSSFFLEHVTTK